VRDAQTPLPVSNRPGLRALRRRVATHASAKSTMLHALSRRSLPGSAELTSRADGDFAIALTDSAAVVVDLLTFYTERFVNEHYLRTATERRSVVELARLLGYQAQPGLAATADVAFTLDPAPGAPLQSRIAAGTGIQSSPDPGQSPVVYETLADVLASPAWNAIRPRPRMPHPASPGKKLSFAGTVAGIAPGDGVMFRTYAGGPAATFGVIRSVHAVDGVPDLPGKPGSPARTDVTLTLLGAPVAAPPVELLPATATAATVPASVGWLGGRTMAADELDAQLLARSATLADVAGAFARTDATPAQALLFRQQRAIFGSQAPLASSLAASVALEVSARTGLPLAVTNWAKGLALPWETASVVTFPGAPSGTVFLDGGTPAVPADSLLVLRDGETWGAYKVTGSAQVSLAMHAISGRATRVHLAPTTSLDAFSVRRTTAYAAPESIALADVAAPEPLHVGSIELDGLYLGLRHGRRVVVVGEPADDKGHQITLATTLAGVVHDFGADRSTTITLADQLPTPLARSSTTIHANVAPASHGETRREVLGSGDSRVPFQRFVLRQPPLTYLSAATASGLRSTLSVWVGEVRWSPVGALAEAGPGAHVYIVREQDGATVVQFGDGVNGARLPTGSANVRAVYRMGSGIAARVHAGQLTLPTSRAGGVIGVVNPAPSEGGDDPEPVHAARTSAPLRVTTIDRVVSLADYALYARAFPGVGKAQAVWARAAHHRGVLVTVAGTQGIVLEPSQGIGANLLAALHAFGDPHVPVALIPYVPRSFRLAVNIRTAPDRARGDVLAAAEHRLRHAFSFAARDLGQPVAASEVVAEIQAVAGVVAATVTKLWTFAPGTQTTEPAGPPPHVLVADAPAPGSDIGTLVGAELIVLDRAPVNWGVLP
jgi:hypothetical protein